MLDLRSQLEISTQAGTMEGRSGDYKTISPFVAQFKAALQHIQSNESPHVPNPPACKRRAAVAVVFRIRPAPSHQKDEQLPLSSDDGFESVLDQFFSQDWVKGGFPEVLLIKRAARAGDRWTSHIALPGGKREGDDSTDKATSIRETREETGVELESEHILPVGNLPERVLTTAWGKTPLVSVPHHNVYSLIYSRLMVLCPFVFLSLRRDLPPLALQPSEVHSAHWVPFNEIISPSLRREVRSDVSERYRRQGRPLMRLAMRAMFGQLIFAAVKIKPTESLYCRMPIDEVSGNDSVNSLRAVITSIPSRFNYTDPDDQPLLLWGLTLAIMADVLEKIDMPATSKLWSWPTFSPPDMRFVIWVLNRNYHAREIRKLRTSSDVADVQLGGIDNTTFSTSVARRVKGSEAGVAGMSLLGGYTDRLRRACIVALVIRLALGATLSSILISRYRRRQ